MTAAWQDGWYESADGLRLHWRELAGNAAWPTLLCIPGLTRNTVDFAALGDRLGGVCRIIAVDLRGRGDSAWPKDAATYVAESYGDDLAQLLVAADIDRFVALGASLGGLLALALVAAYPTRADGIILNDIGPVIAAKGLRRLSANVGRQGNWPTWVHAARDLWLRNADIYPDWGLAEWLVFAKRLCWLNPAGRIVFDYDPRIADAFRQPGGAATDQATGQATDHWPAFAAVAGLPMLSLRGALSDVFDTATEAALAARLPGLTRVTVPGVGHAPTLAEPEAVAAISGFLAGIGHQSPS